MASHVKLKGASLGRKGMAQNGDNGAPGRKKRMSKYAAAVKNSPFHKGQRGIGKDFHGVPPPKNSAVELTKTGRTPENAEKYDHMMEARKKNLELANNVKHVRMETLGIIKDQLFQTDSDGLPYYHSFVKSYLEHAKEDPDSRAASIVSQILLPQETIKMMDDTHEKMLNKNLALLRSRVYEKHFKEQLLVLLDETSQRKIICGGRRCGKTQMIAGLFARNAVEPKTPMLYMHKTFTNSIKQMFDLVWQLSDDIDLPIDTCSKVDGFIRWKNGSSLQFKGLSNDTEADSIRGFKYKIVVIDEAAFQRRLRYLLDEALGPTLADYGRSSQLILVSTPPVVPKTIFSHIWEQPGWVKYSWNFRVNPFIPEPDEFIAKVAADKGVTVDHPFIRREYFGEWIYDLEAEVFKNRKYVPDEGPVPIKPEVILFGVDYGFVDYNSIVGLAYDKKTRKAWVFFEDKFNKSNVSQIAAACMRALKVGTELAVANGIDPKTIYFYADNSDQSISYEMVTQYGMNFSNAYKYNRAFAISQMSGDMALGNVLIKKDGIIDDEMSQIIYARDEEDRILPVIDEDQGIHPDITMALLYAYRMFAFDCNIELEKEEKI